MRPLCSVLLVLSASAARAETIVVPVPSSYSYESTSLTRLSFGGSMSRYIGFTGHTTIILPAKPARFYAGKPGTIRCDRDSCWREGYVAPYFVSGEPERSIRKFFDYQLDCKDKTFNRIGDAAVRGNFSKGWQSVNSDPTALAVERTWCPQIGELPIYKTEK